MLFLVFWQMDLSITKHSRLVPPLRSRGGEGWPAASLSWICAGTEPQFPHP